MARCGAAARITHAMPFQNAMPGLQDARAGQWFQAVGEQSAVNEHHRIARARHAVFERDFGKQRALPWRVACAAGMHGEQQKQTGECFHGTQAARRDALRLLRNL